MDFKTARKLAEAYIDIVSDGQGAIDRENTQAKPYGWLFCWNSKAYILDKKNSSDWLVGNTPIFIDRINGEILRAGPAGIDWFSKYEASIPPARLKMTPEEPDWSE